MRGAGVNHYGKMVNLLYPWCLGALVHVSLVPDYKDQWKLEPSRGQEFIILYLFSVLSYNLSPLDIPEYVLCIKLLFKTVIQNKHQGTPGIYEDKSFSNQKLTPSALMMNNVWKPTVYSCLERSKRSFKKSSFGHSIKIWQDYFEMFPSCFALRII